MTSDIPHFDYPFHLSGASFATNEQDSLEDVSVGVAIVLAYRPGEREMLPEFGSPDSTFGTQPVDTNEIRDAVIRWEPRAATELGADTDRLDSLIQHVLIKTSTQETSDA